MKYLQLFFLFCLLIACDAPTQQDFDFRLAYIQNLKEGDTLSQAYLEAYVKFLRGDSLAKVPFSLSVADTLYNGDDKYQYPALPLKYVLSKDTNNDSFDEGDIAYNRLPQLSTASLQVYEANRWIDNVLIYTRLFNSNDQRPLLIVEYWHRFSSGYRIFAPQKNGFWKLLKIIPFDDVDDDVVLHQAFLVNTDNGNDRRFYAWHEHDFLFDTLKFPDLYSSASQEDYTLSENARIYNIHIFGDIRYSAQSADTLEVCYVWDLRATIFLTNGDSSFRLAQRTIIPKEPEDSTLTYPEYWQNKYTPQQRNYWYRDEGYPNSHDEWVLFARLDSLRSTWIWDSQQKAYICTQIGAANGLFSQQLKKTWDTDKLLCINDPEKFKKIATPPFEKLSGDYKNFVYSDSLVQIGWQMLDFCRINFIME
jgi:hypothetical protein